MTSSGTYAFAPSNGELVLAAYERIQIRAPSLRQEHMVSARRELNFLFSEWSNYSPNLWKVSSISQALTQGTATYSVAASTVMILDGVISLNNGQSNQIDRWIPPISRSEYEMLPNKQVQAPPTTFWFDRLISPTYTLWPVPDGGGPYTFNAFVVLQPQDANLGSGETPDIPYRWLDALVAGLAHRLARSYAPQLEQIRGMDADRAWQKAAAQDVENVPFVLAPSLHAYYRR